MNPYMRFHTRMMLSGKVVSRGYGQNKKEAKIAASKIFCEMLYPRVYKEWLKLQGMLEKEPIQFCKMELPPIIKQMAQNDTLKNEEMVDQENRVSEEWQNTLRTQDQFFSQELLQQIEDGLDSHIDDPDLLMKKELIGNESPLGLLNLIKQKLNLGEIKCAKS